MKRASWRRSGGGEPKEERRGERNNKREEKEETGRSRDEGDRRGAPPEWEHYHGAIVT